MQYSGLRRPLSEGNWGVAGGSVWQPNWSPPKLWFVGLDFPLPLPFFSAKELNTIDLAKSCLHWHSANHNTQPPSSLLFCHHNFILTSIHWPPYPPCLVPQSAALGQTFVDANHLLTNCYICLNDNQAESTNILLISVLLHWRTTCFYKHTSDMILWY